MSDDLTLTFHTDDAPGERALLREKLEAFNAEQSGRDDFQPIAIVVRDAAGEVVGGLVGQTGWDWLHVEVVWVHEDRRGQGVGTRLMEAAEEEARRRGCVGACLSTYSFQARPFYAQRGYAVFGQIEDYPAGHVLYFLQKRW